MATALAPPSSTSWNPSSPGRKGGILLNPCGSSSSSTVPSPRRTSFSSPPSPSRSTRSLDLSSSDHALSPTTTLDPNPSSSSSSNPSGSRSPSIKFATLPDPRADEEEEEGRRLSIEGARSPTAKELSLEVERSSSPSSGWRSRHRGSKSMDGSSTKRSRSPIGISMLNGRVYGSRAMESAKQVERVALEGESFKEWGSQGLGSVGRAEEEDEDDGSGMAWIRKRRESRQREEKEAQEAAALKDLKTGLDSLLLSPDDSAATSNPKPTTTTISEPTTPPPPAPRIQLQPPSRQSTKDFQETRKTAASAGVEIFHSHKEE
ncbi:hypothetical protein BDY24DRAFT_398635 [Mrakia frigida]|uniref:uncharacterized protein n=1 Tax=Mrakia frigida TaxID=29902 RepID=UPI003FCBFFE6